MRLLNLSFLLLFSLVNGLAIADEQSGKLKDLIPAAGAAAVEGAKADCPTCLDASLGGPARPRMGTLKDSSGKEFEVSIISLKRAKEAFDEMAKRPEIPFRYPEDGCYARAHRMAFLLEKEGIIVGKGFIEGDLKVVTKNSPQGYVEWWYHVAPVVLVLEKKGEEPKAYIIDPSLFAEPVPVEKWYAIQMRTPDAQPRRTYFERRFAYYPSATRPDVTSFDPSDLSAAEDTMRRHMEIQKSRFGTEGFFNLIPNAYASEEMPVKFKDTVMRIEPENSGYRVMFRMHAAIYHLRRGAPKYDATLKALKVSQKKQKEIELEVGADSLEIKEIL